MSASIALHHAGESLHGLMARADAGLYAAKKSGRDQVITQDVVDVRPRQDGKVNLAASA